MAFLPDPSELYAVADRISQHATATRAQALRLGAAVGALGWRGLAAAAFRAEAELTIAALRSAAGRLDDAAAALRRHAGRVGALYDDFKALGIDGLQALTDTVVHPDRLLSDGTQLLSDGVDLVDDALSVVGL
ncbi:MAG TPA: hypothetical protein VE442_19730 [Jatrophihabitans sp.]|nr:hypothetical protein [Jatrophihabitans sp.]